MRLLIDADGCPVVSLAVETALSFGANAIILCDNAHQIERPGAETIVVSRGADAVDFRLVNLVSPGDIVVTQDYGLAAMCLAKGAFAVSQDGMEYHAGNIDSLLLSRHTARKIRSAGGRLRGNTKRNRPVQDAAFLKTLETILQRKPD